MEGGFFARFFGAVLHAGPDGVWIMVIGSLVAAACSTVGCFLVLRRMAMLGDAISHAVLPGIVAAFLFTESRNIAPMLIGAGAMGLLTVWLTDVLSRQGKLQSDAAIGVTFTWLFALGVIMVSRYAGQVDLDLDCVLYGELLFAPFTTMDIGGVSYGPRAAWTMGIAFAANTAFTVLAWKQLKVCSFDPGLAASLGVNVALWHYLLMGFVSVTTVAAFESVGAILVVAMLTVPPNAAYLLTDRLWLMVTLAGVIGVASAVSGYALATALDGSIAAAIAAMSGVFFVLAMFFGPRHGLAARWFARRSAAGIAPDAAG